MSAKPCFSQAVFAKTTVEASALALRPVQTWVLEFARCFGMCDPDLAKIELAVEEAFMSVVRTAFEDGETGLITVILEQRASQFVIAIEDMGLPFELQNLEENEDVALNFVLLKQLLDGLVFFNRGKAGKRLELIKNISAENIAATLHGQQLAPGTTESLSLAEQPHLRLLEPAETLALAQLAFRSYGYTYVGDFYYPQRTREQIEHGLMETCVAVTQSGLVIGSLSLFYKNRQARVAECGAAMVDPRYRGLNLFKDMKRFLFDHAKHKGLYGLFSQAVTIHPYTQLGNLSLGAHETGILLSYVPENIVFKKIDAEHLGQRQALVTFYSKLNQEENRVVYAPTIYHDLIRTLYDQNSLSRQVIEVKENECLTDTDTELHVHVRQDMFNDAYIELHAIGDDALAQVLFHTSKLCAKKVEAIYLELDLSSRAAAVLAAGLSAKGYLFASVIPEYHAGDVLKLQYLNHVDFDKSQVTVVSDTAKALLEFVSGQLEQNLNYPS